MIPIITSTTHWWDSVRREDAQRELARREDALIGPSWLEYIKRGLLLALVPALLSCENDDFLSLPTTPGQPDLEILFTRIPVPYSLVQLDSVNTNPTAFSDKQLLTGSLQDTDLGSVSATSFMEFNVGPRAPVTEGAQYDSLVLELIYARSYGTTQEVRQSVEIRALTQRFEDGVVYYNNSNLAVDPSVLGVASLPTKLTGSNDTLRYRLDDALGQDIFDRALATDSTVISSAQFREYLPGLALVPTADNRFVGSFEPQGARIIMYFTDAENAVKEHTFTIRLFFNRIVGDLTGTALAGLDASGEEFDADDGRLYLQSGTGVTPKISMDSVLTFIQNQSDANQRVLLNRVDINLGLADIADTIDAPAAILAYDFEPGSLVRDTLTIDRQRQTVSFFGLFGDQSPPPAASSIPLVDGRYRFPITNYLRALIANDTLNRELIVLAEDFDSSVNRLATVRDSVYLDVYYSLLK